MISSAAGIVSARSRAMSIVAVSRDVERLDN